MKTPIIFLDSDMLSHYGDKELYVAAGLNPESDTISPWAVERLAEVCRQTGAHIVMYDGERDHYKMPDGRSLLDAMKEKGIVVDAVITQELPDRNQPNDILIREESRVRSKRTEFINAFIKENDIDICAVIYDPNAFEYTPVQGWGDHVKTDVDKKAVFIDEASAQWGFDDSIAKNCIFQIQQKEAERDGIYKAIFTPGIHADAQNILKKLPHDFNITENNHITLQFRNTALTDMVSAKLEDGVTAKMVIDGYGYDKNIGAALHVSELILTDKDGNTQNIHPSNGHELHITLATAPNVKAQETVKLFQNDREYHKFSEPHIINGAEYGIFTKKQQVVTKSSIDNNIESKYPQKDQISINSTDVERANILEDKELTICQSRRSLLPPVYDETKRQSVMDVTKSVVSSLHIDNSTYRLEGFPKDVALTNQSIKKSFSIMNERRTDMRLFPEALTALDEICKNAVLIQVEKDSKANKESHKGIQDVYHWMSAFHNGEKVYPVKLTVENDKSRDPEKIYFLLTLGEANSIKSPIYKKEASITDIHSGTEEGPSVGRTSFKCSLPQFIENFNEKHGILLKHFPDSMLSERQQGIKQIVIDHDTRMGEIANERRSFISEAKSSMQSLVQKTKMILSLCHRDKDSFDNHMDFKISHTVEEQGDQMKEQAQKNKHEI